MGLLDAFGAGGEEVVGDDLDGAGDRDGDEGAKQAEQTACRDYSGCLSDCRAEKQQPGRQLAYEGIPPRMAV